MTIETHKTLQMDGVSMSRTIRLASMVFTTWLLVIIAVMLFRQAFDLEIFYVLGFIGLLVIVTMIDASTVPPRDLRSMKLAVVIAFLIFIAIVANRIVAIFTH